MYKDSSNLKIWVGFIVFMAGAEVSAAPYPVSSYITGVTYFNATLKTAANGSDNWPITWSDDGHQYTSFGDGTGFQNSPKASLGVSRIEGDKQAIRGFDVYEAGRDEGCSGKVGPCGGKSYGIIAIDGDLYMWVSPGSATLGYNNSKLYKSTDKGSSWSEASWQFDGTDAFGNGNHAFFNPTFLQFGMGYQGARDGFVYMYANELKNVGSKLEVQKPGEVTLMRVPKDQLMERNAYVFFTGLDGNNAPTWSSDIQQRQPVFNDNNGVGWTISASYNAGLDRYLLITEHMASRESNIGIFDAAEPWGPWTTVLYERWSAGVTPQVDFFWNFSNKWLSADGKHFVLIYSGVAGQDRWNSIEGAFLTNTSGDIVAPKSPTGVTAQ